MAAESAGILLYKREGRGLLVLLVHPGGPFWRNKDDGAWTIPKGEARCRRRCRDDRAPGIRRRARRRC